MKRSIHSNTMLFQYEIKKIGPYFLLMMLCCIPLILTGCGESSTDPYGNGNGSGNGPGNGAPEIGTEPTFDNIQQIFTNSCAACHIGSSTNGVRLDGYQNVMGSEGSQYGELVVQPGDADGSPLVDKIESGSPQHGVRMPEGGPYLSSERINQIKTWINNGAENDQSGGNGGNGNGDGGNGNGGY